MGKPSDWKLVYDGKGEALRSEKVFGDAEYVTDFRFPKKDSKACSFVFREAGGAWHLTVAPDGKISMTAGLEEGSPKVTALKPDGQWNRLHATLKGNDLVVAINGNEVGKLTNADAPKSGRFALRGEAEMEFANIFVRELKKD